MTDHGVWYVDGQHTLAHKACSRCEEALEFLHTEEAAEAYRYIHHLPQIGWWQRFVMWAGGRM